MKKLIFLFTLFSTQLFAQTSAPSHTFEVEMDPIAFVLNGYSFHGIYQPGRFRFDAGVYGIQVPESFHGNKGFTVKNSGFGLKAHYLVKGTNGLFTGLGLGYGTIKAKHGETGVSDIGHTVGIGPEIGYRLFLKKPVNKNYRGLYLSPWVSYGYSFFTDKVKFSNLAYKQKHWEFFPTVHIGYRF